MVSLMYLGIDVCVCLSVCARARACITINEKGKRGPKFVREQGWVYGRVLSEERVVRNDKISKYRRNNFYNVALSHYLFLCVPWL